MKVAPYFNDAVMALALVSVVSAQSCKDYVIISTRGTYELQGPSIGFMGMINTTLATIPNGVEYDTVYPAAANQTYYFGTDDIVRYITTGLASCPDQKYALLGYSQGAIATNVALKNFTDVANRAAYDAIRAVLVVGNPGHVAGSDANFDEFGGTLTRNYTGSFYVAGAGAIPDIFYSDDKVLDICHTQDIVCAPSYLNANFTPYHLLYGSTPKVQAEGAAFLIAQLRGAPGSSSTPVYPNATTPLNSTASVSLQSSTTATSLPITSQTTNAAPLWLAPQTSSLLVMAAMVFCFAGI